MGEHVQIVTTVGSEENARRIASYLVENRLAACVQILGPLRSTYRWKGEITTEQEWQCTAKTRAALFPRVEEAVKKLHPYEVAEILAVPMQAASADYLRWLDEQVD